jgi:hypothetical protein
MDILQRVTVNQRGRGLRDMVSPEPHPGRRAYTYRYLFKEIHRQRAARNVSANWDRGVK